MTPIHISIFFQRKKIFLLNNLVYDYNLLTLTFKIAYLDIGIIIFVMMYFKI